MLLFLYHVSPNAAWRNMYDPVVDSGGTRIARAPVVLDLHYLVAATGADLEREAVFGIAPHALLRLGIIPRATIQKILTSVAPPPPNAPLIARLATETLWQQYEQITLAHEALDADMLSRLWTAFLSPFRPSAGILATTVFLDTDEQFAAGPTVSELILAGRPTLDRSPITPADDRVKVTAP